MRARLTDALLGKTRGALLGLFYVHPETAFYYRRIVRLLEGISPGSIQRELSTLTKLGLIVRSTTGQQVFYQANRDHPIFPELSALLDKTVGLWSVLRTALKPVWNKIEVAFIYGSLARFDERPDSDIDLFIVGGPKLEQVIAALSGYEAKLGRSINPNVYSLKEFKSRLKSGNHFVRSVVRGDKVFLKGSEDELRKLGGEWLAEAGADESR
jgi:predicted nucleotidyltransferase